MIQAIWQKKRIIYFKHRSEEICNAHIMTDDMLRDCLQRLNHEIDETNQQANINDRMSVVILPFLRCKINTK